MTRTSLEVSEKIFAAIGWVDTEKIYFWSPRLAKRVCSGKNHPVSEHPRPFVLTPIDQLKNPEFNPAQLILEKKVIPAYSFAEMVRLLPKLWAYKSFGVAKLAHELVLIYVDARSEEEGMRQAEKHLLTVV